MGEHTRRRLTVGARDANDRKLARGVAFVGCRDRGQRAPRVGHFDERHAEGAQRTPPAPLRHEHGRPRLDGSGREFMAVEALTLDADETVARFNGARIEPHRLDGREDRMIGLNGQPLAPVASCAHGVIVARRRLRAAPPL